MIKLSVFIIFLGIFTISCSKSDTENPSTSKKEMNNTVNEYGLTDFEMKYGLGPIKQRMFLGRVEKAIANKGETIFQTKCTPCHKLDERYIGPAQRYATERRPPEYLMNMMLNPDEMVKRHPEAQKVLAEYISPMTFQNITQDDARNILEYLRLKAQEGRVQNIAEVPLFKNKIN
jgi:hypothetical protein